MTAINTREELAEFLEAESDNSSSVAASVRENTRCGCRAGVMYDHSPDGQVTVFWVQGYAHGAGDFREYRVTLPTQSWEIDEAIQAADADGCAALARSTKRKPMSAQKMAQDALASQTACNAGAVARGLARVMESLSHLDTAERNQHPAVVLMVVQLHHLAGLGSSDTTVFGRAYGACEKLAQNHDEN